VKNIKNNVLKALAIFVLAAAIVFTMTAASCESSGSGGGGGGKEGTLTVKGLPKQELMAVVVKADKDVSTLVSVGFAALVFEAGGSNTDDSGDIVNYFRLSGMFSGEPFAGEGKYKVILINNNYNQEKPTDKNNPMFRTADVNFKSGGASVKFGDFVVVTKEF